ncbi:hypothetical protein AVEN_251520-1 [Araneus ventricosus]|uniref:Mos1 transposase HTH domain-containing protein n=1 Tax=Araneus ventricosus TaxID=182803 RepID=A0A4Y2Q0M9_ARAVE|nr:hypothetical protein AVEN_251520-1 [Araneus ventricosus]
MRWLDTYSNVEVRGTMLFLRAKRFTSAEIHSEIPAAYGSHAMSRPAIVKWCQQFKDGRTDLTDAERKANNAEQVYQTWCSGWKTLFSAMTE